jgi:glycosyltransferase involved in cell wall biosynthesis
MVCIFSQYSGEALKTVRHKLPMENRQQLVSVVIPSFNAARTIEATLDSVQAQTHRNLEILVVDDGSTDDSIARVEERQRADPRIRLVRKENGGVASARNAGIAASRAAIVAFIDADDLWHPTKIEKQLAVMEQGGPELGLVYSPFRLIDLDGFVKESSWNYGVDGWVPHRHFHVNLVGNGSAIMVRRAVLEELGGYSSALRAAGAEGCEDLELQLRIAARYRFGCVPEYLVGYRRYVGNMSSDPDRMSRSGVLAVKTAYLECRGIPGLSMSALLDRYERQCVKTALRRGRLGEVFGYLWREARNQPWLLFAGGAVKLGELLQRRASRARATLSSARRHFYDYAPDEGAQPGGNLWTRRAMARLAQLDAGYRPATAYFAAPNDRERGAADPGRGMLLRLAAFDAPPDIRQTQPL